MTFTNIHGQQSISKLFQTVVPDTAKERTLHVDEFASVSLSNLTVSRQLS